MSAVFITGGKQYRVSEGDKLRVEKLVAEEGSSIDFDTVLMVSDGDNVHVGTPYVAGGKVSATVEGQTTAHYITDKLDGLDVKVTRLAHGVPVGGELDYLDEGTLSAALQSRQSLV